MGTIYVPPGQQEKMKELFLNGQFISEIAKETGRDWKTVAKIVRSADMLRYVEECRAKAKELIPDILDMVHTEMKKAPNKDRVRAGIDYLTRARVFEERQMPTQVMPMVQNLNEDGLTAEEQAKKRSIIEGFAEMAMAVHGVFEIDMPEMEFVKEKLRLDGKKAEK